MNTTSRRAPKPKNFDALAAAAAEGDRDKWILEREQYRQECEKNGWPW